MDARLVGPDLELVLDVDGPVRLVELRTGQVALAPASPTPLVELLSPVDGATNGGRWPGSKLGQRLRTTEVTGSGTGELVVRQRDDETGLTCRTELVAAASAVAVSTTVAGHGTPVWGHSSCSIGLPTGHWQSWTADCDWSGENRWSRRVVGPGRPQRMASTGSWTTARHVPAGVVETSGLALAWQLEPNGDWSYELDQAPSSPAPVLSLTGGADCPATTLLQLAPTRDEALAGLLRARRQRRTHEPRGGVVYNDWLRTLQGDPTRERVLPLARAAAELGCQTYCIDTGWYDGGEGAEGWWTTCGDWLDEGRRFPGGLSAFMDELRGLGLTPGLWCEPEVAGIRSRAAAELPETAFCHADGVRIRERGRFFLDLRTPEGRAHADAAIERLVELGADYVKLDYNTTPGSHHELRGLQRAQADWLATLAKRHPDLVVENCGAGAMRADATQLRHCDLQSTSDQEDPMLYPPIAVGALAHVCPEQAGQWASPQPDWPLELVAFAEVTGLAGRLYQSGPLHELDEQQRELVRAAIEVAHEIAPLVADHVVCFPLGLELPNTGWTAVAMVPAQAGPGDRGLVWLWRHPDAPATCCVPLLGAWSQAGTVYPTQLPEWRLQLDGHALHVEATTDSPSARLIGLTHG